ncbi:BgTH12-00889 [Blumeria graminis f. sp. triticale]|uniref:BgTH12-00889 n=1 Tax=Blumeria graminis f. sp. triticale TaxID=1689686 RepID=A0A9W4D6X2_BLUGR|nr:BgTH12-00889 [Blumeria graminis f. sp. triticale]
MSSSMLFSSMASSLASRRKNSALRSLHTSPSSSIDFSSNDFLSLSTSPLLRHTYLDALNRTTPSEFRLGSGGSRLLDGNSNFAEELEVDLAEFHGGKSALLFNSGFDANSGFFSCVPQRGDVVIHDAYIHASVHEGLKCSRASHVSSFAHNSLVDLKRKLQEFSQLDSDIATGKKNVFVAVESLYSMDGDLAPLREIVDLMEEMFPMANGHVIVDEAHSNGLYGEDGRGIICHLGLEDRVLARLHTFGKAMACNGAAIICDPLLREYLINYARPLIYSTSMSFPSLVAIRSVYTMMKRGVTRPLVTHLHELISYLFKQLSSLSVLMIHPQTKEVLLRLPREPPPSPIFSLLTPKPRNLAAHFQAAGLVVRPIVPPTVPQGTERVRICLHAGNTFAEVNKLTQCLRLWLESETKTTLPSIHGKSLVKPML